jgi:hypothetical protein
VRTQTPTSCPLRVDAAPSSLRSRSRISVPLRSLSVSAKRLRWFGMALRMLAKSGSLGGGTQDSAAGSPASAAGNPQLSPEDMDEHFFLVVRGCALAPIHRWSRNLDEREPIARCWPPTLTPTPISVPLNPICSPSPASSTYPAASRVPPPSVLAGRARAQDVPELWWELALPFAASTVAVTCSPPSSPVRLCVASTADIGRTRRWPSARGLQRRASFLEAVLG